MSTGLECEFIEVEKGKWYYILERGSAPKQAWDWREYADCTGPFTTFDLAYKHLHDNNANPGGFSKQEYSEDFKPDEVLQQLIKEAESPSHRQRRQNPFGPFRW